MKSAKELLEQLKSDESFAKGFGEALKEKREAGAATLATYISANTKDAF